MLKLIPGDRVVCFGLGMWQDLHMLTQGKIYTFVDYEFGYKDDDCAVYYIIVDDHGRERAYDASLFVKFEIGKLNCFTQYKLDNIEWRRENLRRASSWVAAHDWLSIPGGVSLIIDRENLILDAEYLP